MRLWYANSQYKLRLGHLVTIWTPHVSTGTTANLSVSTAPLLVSMFPERDRSCCFMVQENSDDGSLCKKPLGYKEARPLTGLMTLGSFIAGGHEIVDAKILVCVKSLGPKKKGLTS